VSDKAKAVTGMSCGMAMILVSKNTSRRRGKTGGRNAGER
jgi:hypothetical protein